MLSLVRASRPLCRRRLPAALSAGRALHASAVVQKKRPKQAALDNLFDDDAAIGDAFEDDLIPTASSTPTPTPAAQAAPPKEKKLPTSGLSPEARKTRFDELFDFVQTHIGRVPTATDAKQVRNSAWLQLFQLAASEEQLRRVAGAFAGWTAGDRKFSDQHVLAFIRRCRELRCPTLAIDVFSNRPRYRFDLTSLDAVRELLYLAQSTGSFEQLLLVSALYDAYSLPSLADDLVSCSLLLSQCLRTESPEAQAIAEALLPGFKSAIGREEALVIPSDPALLQQRSIVQLAWIRNAAGMIEKRLRERGDDVSWLRAWRVKSGYIPNVGFQQSKLETAQLREVRA